VLGTDVTALPPRARPALGLSRSYQKSRLFGGLTVLDNLYLALRGRRGGRLKWYRGRGDAELLERARHAAEQVALGGVVDTPVASLSHGEQRQLEVAMAQVTDPDVIMLDEPASGLSRGERERLTELLLAIPRDVTLVLIEHDMDVALNVAEYVTMMHDGHKIVEGTPAEIRANETVHDLYLGSGHYE
jgi:branched-chain amino acid transport system ATP-binding protein